MNAILNRRKTGAVILAILVIFLMANIVVQCVNVPKVDASAALVALLTEYGLELLTSFLAVTGVVYEFNTDFGIGDFVSALVDFMQNYYTDYLEYDFQNFLDSFRSDGSITYNDIPADVRIAFLEFAETQSEAISIGGEFGYSDPITGSYVSTGENVDVTGIYSMTGLGATFTVKQVTSDLYSAFNIQHNRAIFEDTDGSAENWWDRWEIKYSTVETDMDYQQLEIMGYINKNNISAYQYVRSNPIPIYDNGVDDFSHLIIRLCDNWTVIVYQQTQAGIVYEEILDIEDIIDKQWVFTGHTDVGMRLYNVCAIDVMSAAAGTITLNDVIDDGATWREEHEDELREEVVPPWTDVGTGTITIPVGGIEDITGEGVGVGDVTTPIDTTVDYPVEYPDTMTGVGNVPLDIPNTVSGNWIENFNFDWSAFADVTKKFPLSIPWDIQRIFNLFDHYEAEPPVFEINLGSILPGVTEDQEYEITLEFLEPHIEFIRWMLWILAVMTFIVFLLKHYISG